GYFDVRAQKGELISVTEVGVSLDHGERKPLRLTLETGAFLAVTVTDGEGERAPPVARADVALVEGGLSSFPHYGRTDAQGRVRLGPFIPGAVTVSAKAPGFVASSPLRVVEADEARISLLRGATVTGRVIDERGFPVVGASLEVTGVDLAGMPVSDSPRTARFREDHFAFALPGAVPLIPAGELGVMPVVPGMPNLAAPNLVQPSSDRGAPWVSDTAGTFTLTPVAPGEVQVVARHPGFVSTYSESFTTTPDASFEVELVLRRGATLEGRVVDERGFPAPGTRIEVNGLERSLGRVTYAAEDGSFAFGALPEEVILSASRAESPELDVIREPLELAPGETLRIELVLPEVREAVAIRCVDERGYAVEDVEVHASSLIAEETLIRTLFSDEEGRALLADARQLPLRISTRRRGWAPSVVELNEAPAEVEIVIERGVTLTGTVVDDRGTAVADAAVTLITPTGDHDRRSDEDGRFSVPDLAPVDTGLLIVAPGYVAHEATVEFLREPQPTFDMGRIELDPAGAIKGRVVDFDGQPVAGVRVSTGRVPTYLPVGPAPLGVAETNSEGWFELAGLALGPATVQAYKRGYFRSEVDMAVRGDRVAEATIE
ncbi:MAG: carboxypeptidase regulatory-like domain-containing protein, partial [Myxococcota bacterium]